MGYHYQIINFRNKLMLWLLFCIRFSLSEWSNFCFVYFCFCVTMFRLILFVFLFLEALSVNLPVTDLVQDCSWRCSRRATPASTTSYYQQLRVFSLPLASRLTHNLSTAVSDYWRQNIYKKTHVRFVCVWVLPASFEFISGWR